LPSSTTTEPFTSVSS
jgi:hypothetical protein